MSSQLSVLSKLCVMNTLLYYLLLFQFCRSLRNISLGDCILGKSNVIITVGWLRRRHQRAPLFSLASVPPNPKPTTGHKIKKFIKKCEISYDSALTRVCRARTRSDSRVLVTWLWLDQVLTRLEIILDDPDSTQMTRANHWWKLGKFFNFDAWKSRIVSLVIGKDQHLNKENVELSRIWGPPLNVFK